MYASATAAPGSPPGSFPADPAFTPIAITTDPTVTFAPAAGPRYYLVVPLGSDSAEGPAGHYGQ